MGDIYLDVNYGEIQLDIVDVESNLEIDLLGLTDEIIFDFEGVATQNISNDDVAELIGEADSDQHFHASDRNRANHSGTQLATTISDLGTAALEAATAFEPAKGTDDNFVTDAEKTVIGNTTGENSGDQDISGKENTGVAAGLISTHETTHPAPTTRDSRNEIAKGVDDNFVTDAEKTIIGNTTGENSGDQDLSGKENTGVAAGLIFTHETTHPAPTTRDSRNEAAGVAAGLVSTHETTHPAPTTRDSRNEVAKGADDNFVTDTEKTAIGNLGTASASAIGDFEPAKGGDDNFVTDDHLKILGNIVSHTWVFS